MLSPGKPQACKAMITSGGIARQVRQASCLGGFKFSTVHRHGHFFYYPETVEALDQMFRSSPFVTGSQTMFRFVMHRYSADPAFREEIVTTHPDVSVPFWFPFKSYIATTREHRELGGWECGQFIEPDEKTVDMALKRSRLLEGGVYTLGFHPAHAKSSVIRDGGDYPWFLHAIDAAKKNGWWITNYKNALDKLNDWQDIRMRVSEDSVSLFNGSARDIKDVMIDVDGIKRRVGVIPANRTETIPL